MPVFQDTQNLYDILGNFFTYLKDDPDIGPKVLASGLVLQFIYDEPEGVIYVDCPKNQIYIGAQAEVKPDVEMRMKSDVAHRFWLGKVNLMISITKGEIKVKGPIPKIMKLLPVIKGAYEKYDTYLKSKGLESMIA